jgi:hypothetical protein
VSRRAWVRIRLCKRWVASIKVQRTVISHSHTSFEGLEITDADVGTPPSPDGRCNSFQGQFVSALAGTGRENRLCHAYSLVVNGMRNFVT